MLQMLVQECFFTVRNGGPLVTICSSYLLFARYLFISEVDGLVLMGADPESRPRRSIVQT